MSSGKIFSSLNISASALSVQRRRMNVIAKNLANVSTTRTAEGGPYQRELVIVREKKPAGNFRNYLKRLNSSMYSTNRRHITKPAGFSRFEEPGGAEVERIAKDNSNSKMLYNPQHPDADAEGYVRLPNINSITEMVDMISATRAYEANLTVVDATKNVVKKSLEI